ncbi:MAG: hypothetical protein KC591_12620 [Gemmatimonadetes bacterium]|nr:hypothetical protein [Gemmatimonadota bacterium]
MGRIVRTDAPSHSLVVRATNLPDTARVRLRQGEIRENPAVEYTDVNWLRDEDLTAPIVGGVFQDTVTVDNTLPSFVRVEIYDGDEELVFSNPIAFVDAVPGEGVAAERIAVDLEPIRVVDAEAFRLSDVSYDAGAGDLTLQGDESPPGLGVLVVEPGPLGAPSSVSGAASWTYDAGRLTLQDFGGAGAEIHVIWGSVDGPVPGELSITTVAMAPGRPNPFGRGLVVDYALPASAPALLEVLDVAGRRIRILQDGFLERGAHRVTWDGRDESGRAAANGVYFVRLRALGEVRVTKAVKLR